MPREWDIGIRALSHCGAVFLRVAWNLAATLFAERICCVRERDEIHYPHDLRRPLVLVSI